MFKLLVLEQFQKIKEKNKNESGEETKENQIYS